MNHNPVIDTHAHLYPANYLDELERIGIPAASTAIARNMQASNEPEEMAARLEMMDAAGVDMQLLSAVPQLPMVDNPRASLGAARMVNDIYADVLVTHPQRFLAYGALPLPHIDASIAEAGRVLDALGFAGVALPATIAGSMTLADPALDSLWQALDERAATVYVHATGGGAASPLVNDHGLVWVNGAPVEDALATLHLMKASVPTRFPRLTFHIAHLGGDLPFLAQRLEDNYEDWGAFESSPLQMLQKMYLDTANFHAPSLRLCAETVGAERLVLGSDYPYFQGAKYTRAVTYVREAGLAPATAERILRENPARLVRRTTADQA